MAPARTALAHRSEQLLARARDAAADHDELRLEEVDDRREPAGERLDGLVPDRARDRVARARGRCDLPAVVRVRPASRARSAIEVPET